MKRVSTEKTRTEAEQTVDEIVNVVPDQQLKYLSEFRELFFARTDKMGRRLPEILGDNDKPITGPWRWNNKDYKRIDYQGVNLQIIASHLSGTLTVDAWEVASCPDIQPQTYAVDPNGTAKWTTIDLDVAGEAHADVPEHFPTQASALEAARKLFAEAEALGLKPHLEITKSGGYRVWIFHHRCTWSLAKDLGRLLLTRTKLNSKIEVFPSTLPIDKDRFGLAVFLPYWGINARKGRQIMIDPATEQVRAAEDFVENAISHRTSPERLAQIVSAATANGEIKETPARRERSERSEDEVNPFVDAETAKQCWQAQIAGCEALREMSERCEEGNELSRAEWLRLATHLRQYGDWGLYEFHRLSAFDSRYLEHETDMMFESLQYGPTACVKMDCGRDPQIDCGMAEGKVSASWFAYQRLKQLPMASSNQENSQPVTSSEIAPIKQDWTADDCFPAAGSFWSISGGRIWHTRETKREGPIMTMVLGQLVQIVSRDRDLEQGSEYITVRWSDGSSWQDATVSRRTISDSRSILVLADRGLMINSENARMIVSYLAHLLDYQQANIPIQWITQSCGHKKPEGQQVFVLGKKTYGAGGHPDVQIAPDADSEGFLTAFRQNGSESEYKEKAQQWIELATLLGKHPVAAFTLGAGFLAPLLADLKLKQNPIVDIAGRSSSGKTTHARLIASLWGLPPEVQGGLIRSWNSTPVFIERLAALCQDLPIFLDESHNARPEAVQNIIYQYGNGTGRGRGNRDGGVQKVARYRGVMFSAGEVRLADVSQHDGTQARILGFWGSPYGEKQGELVKQIAKVSDECYGIIGPAFLIRYISDRETYRKALGQWQDEAVQRLSSASDDGIGERLIDVCAAVEAAMRLACEITSIDWDVTSIVDVAFQALCGNRKTDSAQASLELIGSWAAGHRGMFWSDERAHIEAKQPFDSSEPRELYGKIRVLPDGSEILCILPEILKRVLEQHKHNYHTVLAHWKDRGWLDTDDKKRLTRKVKLRGAATNMIQLSIEGMTAAFGAGDPLEAVESRPEQEYREQTPTPQKPTQEERLEAVFASSDAEQSVSQKQAPPQWNFTDL